MLLFWTPLAEKIKTTLVSQKEQFFWKREVYIAIFFFGDNPSIQVYVNLKKKFAEELGMQCKIFWQSPSWDPAGEWTFPQILSLIQQCNVDPDCVGIICQQPLPPHLESYKDEMCLAVHPSKDIDGLGGIINGWNQIWVLDFHPATVKAVLDLRDHYQLGNMRGRHICVIGQSNIIGKPLALACLMRGAFVETFTAQDTPDFIAQQTKKAEVIMSCTGAIHLVTKNFINPNGEQIIIDVGYGFLEGKAVGDVKFDEVEPLVKAITPVPGGVWPLTVASLFFNIFVIQEQKKLIEKLRRNVR